jgi:hypothetical protein
MTALTPTERTAIKIHGIKQERLERACREASHARRVAELAAEESEAKNELPALKAAEEAAEREFLEVDARWKLARENLAGARAARQMAAIVHGDRLERLRGAVRQTAPEVLQSFIDELIEAKDIARGRFAAVDRDVNPTAAGWIRESRSNGDRIADFQQRCQAAIEAATQLQLANVTAADATVEVERLRNLHRVGRAQAAGEL